MKRVVLVLVLAACGGSTQHSKVEEVPIEQQGGGGSVPPDEVGDAATTTTTPIPTGTAPPGVGPQSLDVQPDAGPTQTAATPHFVQRAGGLTEKECTDMVMVFAKAASKENKTTPPAATDLPKDPTYGQMLADCGQSTTKKQKTCAMAARTSAGWKKCME
ncbi:MAG TPA: hypothetical protein VH054_25690 [Polyangiaceae bacterium]|jgi:hypothetical protein|nr:hypothetical protein [Polyangiaceae bacterium]